MTGVSEIIYCVLYTIEWKRNWKWRERYEGWNFNSGNYLFTTDTK